MHLRLALSASALVAACSLAALQPSGALAADPPDPIAVGMQVSGTVASGSDVAFTPTHAQSFPDGTVCGYTLAWGDDRSLSGAGTYNETYGKTSVWGTGRYCDGWTVTLPWSAAHQWDWGFYAYVVVDGTPTDIAQYDFDGNGFNRLHAAAPDRVPAWTGISGSSLPGVWTSMSPNPTAGKAITVTAHPYGGYASQGAVQWMAAKVGDDQTVYRSAGGTGLTFRFTPPSAGTTGASSWTGRPSVAPTRTSTRSWGRPPAQTMRPSASPSPRGPRDSSASPCPHRRQGCGAG